MDKIKKYTTKFKDFILGTNFAMLGFVAYVSKLVLSGASLSDALVITAISALYGYTLYLRHKSPDPVRIDSEIEKRLNNIASHVDALRLGKGINEPNKKPFRW